jgi:competence ComEA-like helix-hairpin-helix protein
MSTKSGGKRGRSALALLWVVCFICFACLPAVPAAAKKKPPSRPIDINVANIKELEELPGVGPTTAQAIIDTREKTGKFKRVEDLLVIHGISATKLDRMRPYVTVGPPASSLKPTTPTTSPTTHPPAKSPSSPPASKPAT